MSPEQGLGTPIDGRSDIYSLGVVLFEMATGQVTFTAETPIGMVVKHIHDALPVPSQINPNIPEPLQRMIFRAMHKEPSERFPTAGAMAEAIATMTVVPLPSTAESAATVPIGGVPPFLTPVIDSSRGVDDTMPTFNTGADGTASRPAQGIDDAAATATAVARSAQPAGTPAETSGMRRPVAIAAAALVVLALRPFFAQRDTPDTELTRATKPTAPDVSDAASAPPGDASLRSERAGAGSVKTTLLPSTGQPDLASPDLALAAAIARRADAATTGELETAQGPTSETDGRALVVPARQSPRLPASTTDRVPRAAVQRRYGDYHPNIGWRSAR